MPGVDARVYVVPTSTNVMGSLLARCDPWYRRQVHSAFTSSCGAPRVKLMPRESDKVGTLSPLYVHVSPLCVAACGYVCVCVSLCLRVCVSALVSVVVGLAAS